VLLPDEQFVPWILIPQSRWPSPRLSRAIDLQGQLPALSITPGHGQFLVALLGACVGSFLTW